MAPELLERFAPQPQHAVYRSVYADVGRVPPVLGDEDAFFGQRPPPLVFLDPKVASLFAPYWATQWYAAAGSRQR
jgi:hypothetical protein